MEILSHFTSARGKKNVYEKCEGMVLKKERKSWEPFGIYLLKSQNPHKFGCAIKQTNPKWLPRLFRFFFS